MNTPVFQLLKTYLSEKLIHVWKVYFLDSIFKKYLEKQRPCYLLRPFLGFFVPLSKAQTFICGFVNCQNGKRQTAKLLFLNGSRILFLMNLKNSFCCSCFIIEFDFLKMYRKILVSI